MGGWVGGVDGFGGGALVLEVRLASDLGCCLIICLSRPSACSGERLTLVVNPQWQTQGQVISGALR